MENASFWYESIKKPFFAPPAFLFGVAWSILYPIIFISFGYTGFMVYKKEMPQAILMPLLINLVSNFLFSPLQFGLKNNYLALLDIIVVLISLIWFIKMVFPHSKIIAYAQVPYLLWVSFATILQISITWLNK